MLNGANNRRERDGMAANRKQRRRDRTPGSRQGQPRPAGPASGASQSAAARADTRATRAAKLQKDGAFDAAAEVWRDILAGRPDDLNALQHLGVLQLQHPAGELDTAVKLLTRAADLLPGSAPAQMHAGLAMLRAGQLQQALSRLEQAVAIKPDYAEAHNNLGVAFKELERFEDAGASFQAAVRLKPDYGEATRNLEGLKNLLQADTQTRRRADALAQANRHGEAAELYRTLVQKRPTHAKLRYALANSLHKDLQYDAANAELDAILAHDPTQQRVYLARGMIAHDRAEYQDALASTGRRSARPIERLSANPPVARQRAFQPAPVRRGAGGFRASARRRTPTTR
ncbi:MAG: tetratricopeptide repeat protein [Rhodovibrio sp.]|nr:tetratricopeptide repeat protein [Rhodovibrio sp.]